MKKTKGHIKDIYPLSPMQEGMLFHTLYEPGSLSYVVQTTYRLKGELNIPLVEKSLNELFKRHDVLRTVFIHEDVDQPLQVILKERTVDFYFLDLRQVPGCKNEAGRDSYIYTFKEEDKRKGFLLSKDVLMRITIFQLDEAEYEFIWSNHHILMDGWCLGILIREFFDIYRSFVFGRPCRLPNPTPYKDYITWLEQQDRDISGKYWNEYLEDYDRTTGVPRTLIGQPGEGYKKERITVSLSHEKTAVLERFAARNMITLNTFLQAVWGILLAKYNGRRDVVFGVVVSGRPGELSGVESMVGLFLNTIPVRIRYIEGMRFSRLLWEVHNDGVAGKKHHYYPLADIQAHSALKQRLLDHILIFENYPINARMNESRERETTAIQLQLSSVETFEQTNYDFVFAAVPGERFNLRLNYNAYAFTKEAVERTMGHLLELIHQILNDAESEIDELDPVTQVEREQLLFCFNHIETDFPLHKPVTHFIGKHSENTPDRIALECDGHAITYRKMEHRTQWLALRLRDSGLREDRTAAILMDRAPEMAFSILAVWKAGGAYIPLDISYPVNRVLNILSDSGCGILLTGPFINEHLEEEFRGTVVHTRDNDILPPSASDISDMETDVNSNINMNNLAYVIYTSGSTGKPKGVMVEHIGMMNHLWAKIGDLKMTADSILVQNASQTFDISVWQFFAAMMSGGRTVIYPNSLVLEPSQFWEHLVRDQISILEVVPSYLSVLLETLADKRWMPIQIAYLVVTGEEVKPMLLKQWFRLYPGTYIINAYGPTEASDDITHHIMKMAPEAEMVPIGKPVRNMNIYIIDDASNMDHLKLCPIGVKGEICVAGVGVGRGYLNSQDKTRDVFREDLFSKKPGNRLYRTGDLGRWLEDGTIEFFGRKDKLVKIRGFRIELGEIENRLAQYPDIKDAVVIDREEPEEGKYLCAYFIPAVTGAIDTGTLKTHLSHFLPEYMVPTYFVELPAFPLTTNGKIDREKLPDPLPSGETSIHFISARMLDEIAGISLSKERQPSVEPGYDNAGGNVEQLANSMDSTLLTEADRVKVLFQFNKTGAPFPRNESIHQVFEQQSASTPGNIALVLNGDGNDGSKLSFTELNGKSNQLARWLIQQGITPGSIVAVTADPSFELIIAVLAVMKAGCIYLPVEFQYPEERISYMLKDSAAVALLTRGGLRDKKTGTGFNGIVIDIAEPGVYIGDTRNLENRNRPEDPFLNIYTSGTTGNPKGVLVTHRNLLNYITWFSAQVAPGSGDSTLLLSSFAYDLCYTLVYSALLKGACLHIVSDAIYADTETLLHYMQEHEITYLKVTPSFLSGITGHPSFTPGKLPQLRVLLLGGEPINVKDVETVHQICPHLKVMNHYGPTEATIGSVAGFLDFSAFGAYKKDPVIGSPIHNTQVYILDTKMQPVPVGVSGELWIAGEGVAAGYLNRPEMTAEKFVTQITPITQINQLSPLYRTGDRARWLPNGTIRFLGRVDHQVKIRGFRIELGEIESKLAAHGDIKEVVVMVRKDKTRDNQLWAFITADEKLSEPEIREYLAKQLPYYMLPSYIVQLEKMPLNPNKKINRKVLEFIQFDNESLYEAPGSETEEKLMDIWSDVLGINKEMIGIDANFFALGGHSLKVIAMCAKIHKYLRKKVPLREVFNHPTIRELTRFLEDQSVKDLYKSIQPEEKKEYYPLSSAQKRLYFLQQLESNSITYNMSQILKLEETPDISVLEEVFKKLIQRHESLRTSFQMVRGRLVQRIHDRVEFSIYSEDSEAANLTHVFDLSKAPLLRVSLIRNPGEKYLLLVVMHHIISDGISNTILGLEFNTLYRGGTLPIVKLQYKDFSQWQNHERENESIKKQEEYWLKQFDREIPILNLPLDFARPRIRSTAGGALQFEIGREEAAVLRQMSLNEKTTMFVVAFSLYSILLSKLSGKEEVIVGTVTSGRRHADLEKVIGMFVNTLALICKPLGEKTFLTFLRELKLFFLEAFENQEYPFDDLVEKVAISRNMDRNPLFDVMFVFQNINSGLADQTKETGTANAVLPRQDSTKEYESLFQSTKFDLTLNGVESSGKIFFLFQYAVKLFKKETIQRFSIYFKRIATLVMKESSIKIRDIDLISEEEKNQILFDFNNTSAEYPKDKTIHQLFEEQAERMPDYIALVGASEEEKVKNGGIETLHATSLQIQMSYRQLNEQSDRLACLLIEKGVEADIIVAIMIERSVEMIIGIIGILKACGAYLPIDPDYPLERIDYMLKDSKAKLLAVANELEGEKVRRWGGEKVLLKSICHPSNYFSFPHSAFDIPRIQHSNHLAYVIYTSGTTGRPKGVMVMHRGIVNTLLCRRHIYQLDEKVRALQLFSFAFDAFVTGFFNPIIVGGTVVLPSHVLILNIDYIKKIIHNYGITHIVSTPSLYSLIINNLSHQEAASLAVVVLGGERMLADLVEKTKAQNNNTELYVEYGVTEASVISTLCRPQDLRTISTIGSPTWNTQIYILDNYNNMQPIGVAGEIWIAGEGLARGYLNRPELTAEKFNQDLWDKKDDQDKSGALRAGLQHSAFSIQHSNLYRTGDLGRWLSNGNIEYLNRIDDQVKIRGYRIELGEIESKLLTHNAVKDAVVLCMVNEVGDNYLCAYFVPAKADQIPNLQEFLTGELPGYMIPAFFVPLEKIPLTPNGKIDRSALLKIQPMAVGGYQAYQAPRDEIEQKLVQLWAVVLGRAVEEIGIADNFFRLGGHSLKAITLASKVHKELNVEIPLVELFKTPSIMGLAKFIKQAEKSRFLSISGFEEKEYYPLSSAQKRLYIMDKMEPGSTTYNMPGIIPLPQAFDGKKIEETFKKLIKRHESLRTSFNIVNSTPVQFVHNEVSFNLDLHDNNNIQDFLKKFVRPFDLAKAPLIRAALLKENDRHDILIVDMHHIISDGVSLEVLANDFQLLYNDRHLPPLKLQYKDYSEWQNSAAQQDAIQRQKDYWLQEFSGSLPLLNLPLDYSRKETRGFAGQTIKFILGKEETTALKELALKEGFTLFFLCICLFNIFLYKITGQEDIIIGTTAAGRKHIDLENVIGMFVNTIPLRNFPAGEKKFSEFAHEIKKRTLSAFANEDYQFEDILSLLGIKKTVNRNPLFDVAFNFLQKDKKTEDTKNTQDKSRTGSTLLPEQNYHYNPSSSRFDLSLSSINAGDEIFFSFEYCSELFRKEKIEKFIKYFLEIITQVLKNVEIKLCNINISHELISAGKPFEKERSAYDEF